jgi:hypothetical protein
MAPCPLWYPDWLLNLWIPWISHLIAFPVPLVACPVPKHPRFFAP